MTFEQLKYFIAAAEHDTLSEAAETLYMGQSNLSKQIMKIEKELGVTLFDRSRRSASLTDAGKRFYRDALELTAKYEQSLKNLEKYRDNFQRDVHVGTLPILNHYNLTRLFKTFSDSHEDIHLFLEEAEEEELLGGLAADRFDLIIARKGILDFRQHASYPLAEDRLTVVLSENHPLAQARTLSLSDISQEPFLLMNRNTLIYQTCMEEFHKYGIKPNVLRTARTESILSAVAVGEGISLLAQSNLHVFRHDHITYVPLEPSVTLPVVLARKKNKEMSPAVKKLVHFLVQES